MNLYALSTLIAITVTALYAHSLYSSSWISQSPGQEGGGGGSGGAATATGAHGRSGRKDWDILYHLGGNGPWIRKVDGIVTADIGPPEGCEVDQVHMMSRHGERFPTTSAGARMLDLLKRIRESSVQLKGDLEFVNDWEYFTQDPSKHLEQLVTVGPYAGTLEAFTTGVKLRTRYAHLLPANSDEPKAAPVRLWASDSNRVIDTARYFRAGFFGLDDGHEARKASSLQVIPETADLGADTLTPGDTCLKYRNDIERGHDYGAAMLAKFRATYLGAIGARLQKQNPQMEKRFEDGEIYSMQEMCGFETLARGSSPWCDVFTHDDWENFEYARDVIHYYRAGPGNRYGPAMGWLWLNATANLLSAGPSSTAPLFFSFVHDGDIIPMLAALDIFASKDKHHLPVTHVPKERTWRTSQVTPMGGRVIFERLTCRPSSSSSSASTSSEQTGKSSFIRININDGIVALPDCSSGPGHSCPLPEFLEIIRERGKEVGDFREVCGLGKDAPDRISFLHQ
ncbi:MAG: acid phosphatase pho5 [Sclerophora amabilis]|nr:MAG: acid phosphatase pho5 [Sclerophora amabilis]